MLMVKHIVALPSRLRLDTWRNLLPRTPPPHLCLLLQLRHRFVSASSYNPLTQHVGATSAHHGPPARNPQDGHFCLVAGPHAAVDSYGHQGRRRRRRLLQRDTARALGAQAGRWRAGRGAQARGYRQRRVEVQSQLRLPMPGELTTRRFNDIAWSQPSEDYPEGIIAGALDSGALVLWDAEKLRAGTG